MSYNLIIYIDIYYNNNKYIFIFKINNLLKKRTCTYREI